MPLRSCTPERLDVRMCETLIESWPCEPIHVSNCLKTMRIRVKGNTSTTTSDPLRKCTFSSQRASFISVLMCLPHRQRIGGGYRKLDASMQVLAQSDGNVVLAGENMYCVRNSLTVVMDRNL